MLALVTFGGCASFAEDGGLSLLDNSCSMDLDCGSGQRCDNGICVQRSTDEQTIILQVTPEFMPDGSEAVPLFSELTRIEGTTTRSLDFRLPVPVRVRLRHQGEAIAGEVRITPSSGLSGVTPRSLSVVSSSGLDEAVPLPAQASFVFRGVPEDRSLPPVEVTATAAEDLRVNLDVDALASRTYVFTGLPAGGEMQLLARTSVGGPRISSVATVADGRATLQFGSAAESYVLELTPTEAQTMECERPGSLTPSFRIQSGQLMPGDDGDFAVQLPATLPSIDYAGHVALCDETATAPETLESMTMTLRSVELGYETMGDSAVTAYFQGDSRVAFNGDTGLLQFCAPALPGTYEVIVNAPPTLGTCVKVQDQVRCGCGIFAEERLIQAPPGSTAQRGAALTLPTMASLSGTLSKADGMPVMGASVEATALGLAEGVELAAEDRGLTAYNRSRQATSDSAGTFRMPLDVGAYDVTIKPPDGSGFAWTVVQDVLIGNRSEEFVQQFTLSAPLSITGRLSYRNGSNAENETFSGAVIRAYRLIAADGRTDKRRAIALGQTLADDAGRFTLLVPPDIRSGWY